MQTAVRFCPTKLSLGMHARSGVIVFDDGIFYIAENGPHDGKMRSVFRRPGYPTIIAEMKNFSFSPVDFSLGRTSYSYKAHA